MTDAANKPLAVGDWVALEFGFVMRVFYVLRVSEGDGAWLGHPNWLASSAVFMPAARLSAAERLGSGRARWWWRFMPWRELHVPFTKPRGLHIT